MEERLQLSDLHECLWKIQDRLQLIENHVNQVIDSTENMNRHITFIEKIYESIKIPFYKMMNFVSSSSLISSDSLEKREEVQEEVQIEYIDID